MSALRTTSYNKYHAKPYTVDGVTFASKAEGHHYLTLKALQRAGVIAGLELQPRYPLVVNGYKVCTYVADFRYWDVLAQRLVICDVKGYPSPVYKLKRKLMWACYGIDVLEVPA